LARFALAIGVDLGLRNLAGGDDHGADFIIGSAVVVKGVEVRRAWLSITV
jgi:hypothetical protein